MNTPHTPKTIRVTVPVSPEVLDRFKRLSQVAGQSVGRAMGEWLEGTAEGLEPMIAILQEHKARPAAAVRSLQDYAQTLDVVTRDLFDSVRDLTPGGTVGAGAHGRLQASNNALHKALKTGLTPPSSNTGGKGTKAPKTGGSSKK